MKIDLIWEKILEAEGETFYTKTGLPFEYEIISSTCIKVYRDDKPVGNIKKENIKFIIDNPNLMVCEYRDSIKERTTTYSLALVKYFDK